jgi:hypothetical protein
MTWIHTHICGVWYFLSKIDFSAGVEAGGSGEDVDAGDAVDEEFVKVGSVNAVEFGSGYSLANCITRDFR